MLTSLARRPVCRTIRQKCIPVRTTQHALSTCAINPVSCVCHHYYWHRSNKNRIPGKPGANRIAEPAQCSGLNFSAIHQSNRGTFGPYPDIQMIRFSGRIHFIDGAAAVQKVPSGCVDTAVTGIVVRPPPSGEWRGDSGGTRFPAPWQPPEMGKSNHLFAQKTLFLFWREYSNHPFSPPL